MDEQLLLLAGVSRMAVAVMLSLSWIAYGPMAMPGLALIVAMLVQRALASRRRPRGIAVIACSSAAILLLVSAKLHHPFFWEGWTDGPVSEATERSDIPQLSNFRLPPTVNVFLERVTTAVTANSNSSDTILCISLGAPFYAFSQRKLLASLRIRALVRRRSRLYCPPRRGPAPRASTSRDRLLSIQSRTGARSRAPLPGQRE